MKFLRVLYYQTLLWCDKVNLSEWASRRGVFGMLGGSLMLFMCLTIEAAVKYYGLDYGNDRGGVILFICISVPVIFYFVLEHGGKAQKIRDEKPMLNGDSFLSAWVTVGVYAFLWIAIILEIVYLKF